MDYIDDVVESANSWERRNTPKEINNTGPVQENAQSYSNKTRVGVVEQFFSKVSVVAIKLDSDLRVGDIIEIGNKEDAVRQRVSSMQIERKDVDEAHTGDSVGILMKYRVSAGTDVYRWTDYFFITNLFWSYL